MDKPHRFARVPRPGRPPARGRFTHLALERLEERCVTAVLAVVTDEVAESVAWPDEPALVSGWEPGSFSLDLFDQGAEVLSGESVVSFPGEALPGLGEPFPDWEVPEQDLKDPQGPGPSPAVPTQQEPVRDPPSPAHAEGPNGLDRAAAPRLSVAPVAATPEAGPAAFRISRASAEQARVEVRYTVTAHGRAAPVSAERVAVLRPGAAHVDVPAEAATGQEIVTLTLREGGGYQVARPAGTLFLAGDSRACSEAALLSAYHEGRSEQALNALVERNRPAVLRACHRVLGNWHDAEDVSQLVFLALAQGQVRLHSTLAGWLRTVARNAAIVALRARNRRYRHEHRASRSATAPPEALGPELREELDAALAWLTAPLRDAVRLRYLEGWSQLDAARILGCPRGTLAQRAALGAQRLGDVLRERGNLAE